MIHIEVELQKLKAQMSELIDLTVKQMNKSLIAIKEFDKDLAREVIINEKRVNALELKIDKDCENLFALQTPVAGDLRFVFANLKINSNYERIGDNAAGIAQYVLLNDKKVDPELFKMTRFNELGENVQEMLEDIALAYQNDDTKLARGVFKKDSVVNEINKAASENIAGYITKNPDNVLQALYLQTIIRKMERTGDHVTNIAEEIIFYTEGKILKHGKKDNAPAGQ